MSEIECYRCGACCAVLPVVVLLDEDVERLRAAGVWGRVADLCEENALGLWNGWGVAPCPFLVDDQCSIYDHRPGSCRTFEAHVGRCERLIERRLGSLEEGE